MRVHIMGQRQKLGSGCLPRIQIGLMRQLDPLADAERPIERMLVQPCQIAHGQPFSARGNLGQRIA